MGSHIFKQFVKDLEFVFFTEDLCLHPNRIEMRLNETCEQIIISRGDRTKTWLRATHQGIDCALGQ
jgi:hypothetical protein